MLKGILVELWMSFVDISWCLCGHFAWFWLGICLRSSFPIFCPWKSIKIQQKYLVWIGIVNCGRWTNDTLKIWKKHQYLFNIWHIVMRTKVLQLSLPLRSLPLKSLPLKSPPLNSPPLRSPPLNSQLLNSSPLRCQWKPWEVHCWNVYQCNTEISAT